jgi:predicted enzyme related to lactoylglutathione lyase
MSADGVVRPIGNGRAAVNRMSTDNALAAVAVKDLKAATSWYTKLLGRPADSTPMPELAEWKFERGGWLQVYELPERAGQGSFTLAVTDLDAVIAHAQKLGLDTNNTWSTAQVRTLMTSDPDGNHIAFAEAFDKTMAR